MIGTPEHKAALAELKAEYAGLAREELDELTARALAFSDEADAASKVERFSTDLPGRARISKTQALGILRSGASHCIERAMTHPSWESTVGYFEFALKQTEVNTTLPRALTDVEHQEYFEYDQEAQQPVGPAILRQTQSVCSDLHGCLCCTTPDLRRLNLGVANIYSILHFANHCIVGTCLKLVSGAIAAHFFLLGTVLKPSLLQVVCLFQPPRAGGLDGEELISLDIKDYFAHFKTTHELLRTFLAAAEPPAVNIEFSRVRVDLHGNGYPLTDWKIKEVIPLPALPLNKKLPVPTRHADQPVIDMSFDLDDIMELARGAAHESMVAYPPPAGDGLREEVDGDADGGEVVEQDDEVDEAASALAAALEVSGGDRDAALGAAASEPAPGAASPAACEPTPGATPPAPSVAPWRYGIWEYQVASTGRSNCRECGNSIEKGSMRFLASYKARKLPLLRP